MVYALAVLTHVVFTYTGNSPPAKVLSSVHVGYATLTVVVLVAVPLHVALPAQYASDVWKGPWQNSSPEEEGVMASHTGTAQDGGGEQGGALVQNVGANTQHPTLLNAGDPIAILLHPRW